MMSAKKYFLLFLGVFLAIHSAMGQSQKFNHDYSQTLVMKLALSIPDGEGGSKVFCNFETALDLIKKADQLSLQVPKVIYLVGWQYNGHDDKYPAFFKVNKMLKRAGDATAEESLSWLIKEAKKYHTTVSLHINMTDAYDDSPLWNSYLKDGLISKQRGGELMVIGNYNNKKAYQINYKKEWESGWTQKRIDSLLTIVPELKNTGTIHIDAWIARESKGHHESLVTESEYQKKALAYWRKKGLDVTSEWVMDYMTGSVPYAWHFNARTQADYLNVPAKVYTGSGINPDIKTSDFGLGFLFGTSMYGENLWPIAIANTGYDHQWDQKFAREFYLNCLQYFFLNRLERKSITGMENERTAFFSKGVTTSLKDSTVRQNNTPLREGNTVLFPVDWKEEPTLAAYSAVGTKSKRFTLFGAWKYFRELDIYLVGMTGLERSGKVKVMDGKIPLTLKAGQPYVLKPHSPK
ncbi:MAG: endo-alpha-N-acetylgalactosaminidase family protein [Flavobacteriaceae bacterium]